MGDHVQRAPSRRTSFALVHPAAQRLRVDSFDPRAAGARDRHCTRCRIPDPEARAVSRLAQTACGVRRISRLRAERLGAELRHWGDADGGSVPCVWISRQAAGFSWNCPCASGKHQRSRCCRCTRADLLLAHGSVRCRHAQAARVGRRSRWCRTRSSWCCSLLPDREADAGHGVGVVILVARLRESAALGLHRSRQVIARLPRCEHCGD